MAGAEPGLTRAGTTPITPALLLSAYARGVFPMADSREAAEVFWVDPRLRGILPLDGLHISRSLARKMRRGGFDVLLDADFATVVDACAARDETWINAEIRRLYLELFGLGHAHSIEIRRDGALIGGLYGVALNAAFFGESMFSREADGSKLALAHLVAHLRARGYRLFDCQFLTPHLASLGAIEISRSEYRRLLAEALRHGVTFAAAPAQEVMQRSTQTS